MDRIAEKIIKQIDSGMDIMDIAKFFGGINSMLEQVKKYPYLQALVMTKLGGEIYGSVPDEDENMIPFEIPFVIVAVDEDDIDDFPHYNVDVNFLIPEVKIKKDLQLIYNWLNEYLMDLGSEVGSFNDRKFNHSPTWIHPEQINGIYGGELVVNYDITNKEFLNTLPKNYFRD